MSLVRTALWGPHVLLLILAAGVWFTLRGRCMQLWKLPRMAAGALRGRRADGGKISPFQALSASLAGSLGTGNIIGVAAALTAGGPGAVVWMWISAFFGMMTVYAEGVLAAKFATGEAPGAIGYVRRALGKHAAKLYAAGCVLSALGMGTMAQTGAVSAALGAVGVPPWAAGLLVAVLLVLCVRGGLQKAVRVTEKLVPFMAGLFLLACGAVLALRAAYIPAAVQTMVREAFSLRAVGGGAVGMATAMRVGVSRGVFTNEAGLGSGTFALAAASGKTPAQIGTLGALQVFIDTIVMCTVTALCLLVSPARGRRRRADARFLLRGARRRGPRGGVGLDGALRLCDRRRVELLRHGRAALPRARSRRGRAAHLRVFRRGLVLSRLHPAVYRRALLLRRLQRRHGDPEYPVAVSAFRPGLRRCGGGKAKILIVFSYEMRKSIDFFGIR